MAYFDTSTVSGFTIRVYYEEDLGIVTITELQVQSTLYTGQWYLYGTIKVNGETVLTMGGDDKSTYSIDNIGAGSTWWPAYELVSKEFPPVSSAQIFAASTDITVDIDLHRINSDLNINDITGSATVSLTAGVVYTDNGSGFDVYQCYIDNGTDWDIYIPYIDNGTGWDQCG